MDDQAGYRVSMFPYVPLAGILVNYTLLAQLPASGIQFLAGYVGLCLLCYFITVAVIPESDVDAGAGRERESASTHGLVNNDSSRGA